jgi:hypothetical protein
MSRRTVARRFDHLSPFGFGLIMLNTNDHSPDLARRTRKFSFDILSAFLAFSTALKTNSVRLH